MTKQEQETLSWYQDAFEVLSPLRFHLHNVSERSSSIPYTDKAVYIPKSVLKAAEEALEKAEEFFVKKEVNNESTT